MITKQNGTGSVGQNNFNENIVGRGSVYSTLIENSFTAIQKIEAVIHLITVD
jgi:hypothetical protein